MPTDPSPHPVRLTLRDLRLYDGKEGRPAYAAFEGKIYDVTGSSLWMQGRHSDRHNAGEDLTERMVNAPHDESVLARFPVVGEVVPESLRNRYIAALQSLHLHPMVVHFSEALPMLAAFFAFLYLATSTRFFEDVSFYMIILGFFSSLGCLVTGFFSWWVTYERTLTRVFSRKIIFSIALTVIISVLYAWRSVEPHVLTGKAEVSPVYAILLFLMVPVVVILGHYGGKIVYG